MTSGMLVATSTGVPAHARSLSDIQSEYTSSMQKMDRIFRMSYNHKEDCRTVVRFKFPVGKCDNVGLTQRIRI